jgi:S-adenosyl-L-methionine hydrolase (adenosine-forming)
MQPAKTSRGTRGITITVSDRIITLTTDFGLKDPYVAEMKAAILGISSASTLVDITHEIEKFNIRMGAFVLSCAANYFPKGTIHVAVVDPSVGTRRRPILIETKRGFFIGPDNGVLLLAAEKDGIETFREITNQGLMLPEVSNTFHGRDVFAPTAAHLANGVDTEEFGPEISKIFSPLFARVTSEKGVLTGEVLHLDDFGNIITNITIAQMGHLVSRNQLKIRLGHRILELKFRKTYGEAESNEALALIGSHSYLEIAVNQGNAVEEFKVKIGDRIAVSAK